MSEKTNSTHILTRRNFLKLTCAGTCGAAVHGLIPQKNSWLALAEPGVQRAVGANPVLIVVNLAGGCSYNIAPIYHGAYRDKNKTISFSPEESLPLNSEQGLHPSLTGLKSVYDEGKLALLNLVGYPNPNRSHDESTDIWFRGMRQMSASVGGWGARLTCQMDSIFSGVSLGGQNLLISGDCNAPRSYGSLNADNFGESAIGGTGSSNEHSAFLKSTRDQMILDAAANDQSNYLYVKGQIDNIAITSQTIRNATNKALPNIAPVAFPNSGFGQSCRDAAKLLNAPELKTRFIFLQRGGFDTHAGERQALAGNLADINGGLTALIAAAKVLGRWQDVTIITMSEFSRTFENGSGGTDHGHGAAMLVAGGGVRGGVLSPTPSVADTMASDFYRNYNVDFRGVFSDTVRAMGYDPGPIFPEAFSYSSLGLFS